MMQRTITILGITFILLLSSISISTSQNQKPDHFISNNDSIDINPMKWMRQEKIYTSDEEKWNEFGNAIDVDGDYAIIGAQEDGHYNGSVYFFKLEGERWIEQQKIIPQYENYDFSFFGRSVAISGDYAIVGTSYYENSEWNGCALIYKRNGDEWIQQTVLETHETLTYAFGLSVAIDGRYAVVGSPDYMNIAEYGDFVSVYYRDEETWLEQAILSPSDTGNESVTFGWSVSIDSETIIVGAPINPNDYNYSGSAYVFQKNGDSWIEQQRIDSPRGYDFETFGISVSIDDEYIAIARSFDGNFIMDDPNPVNVYRKVDDVWLEIATLLPDDDQPWGIGESVSIDGNNIIVGGPRIAYIFTYKGGENWDQQAMLLPDDPSGNGDGYGFDVSISGNHAFVGAMWDSEGDRGAVYHFINREIDIELSNLRCENGYISCDVKNNEDESFNLRCSMTLLNTFSMILFNGAMTKHILLEPGERETIRSHFIFGLGLCNLCIKIHNDSVTKSVLIIGSVIITI